MDAKACRKVPFHVKIGTFSKHLWLRYRTLLDISLYSHKLSLKISEV